MNLKLKVFTLIFLSFFIVQCDEVDKVLYGDEATEEGSSPPVTGTDVPFLPDDLIGMNLWLDSSDITTLFTDDSCTTAAGSNGDAIACWQDKSGNGLDAIQSALAMRPLLAMNEVNSLSALQFDDNNSHNFDITSSAWASTSNDFTAFIVYNQDVTDTLGVMFSTYPSASNDFMLVSTTYSSNRYRYYDLNNWRSGSSYSAGAWNIDSYHRTSNNMSLFMNGELDATLATLNGITPGAARIGSYTTSFSNIYKGHIAEIVWFTRSLSLAERQKMEGHLAHKWGRTGSLDASHPYKVETPTTFIPDEQ